jgi:hypothetical protein
VHDVLVVAGGQAAPVLESVEAAFDDVAAAVAVGVEVDWSAAAGASVLAVADLVGGFGDDGGDAARAQLLPVRPRRVGLVREQRVRCRAGTSRSVPGNPQLGQQQRQGR